MKRKPRSSARSAKVPDNAEISDALALPTAGKARKKSAYHHGNLRNAIIDAVAQLIGERKSLAFQLKEVAQLVGATEPAIYRHFDGKQALLVATAVAGYDLQRQFRDYALAKANTSALHRAFAIAYAYIHFSLACPGHFLLLKHLETAEILSSKRYQQQRAESERLIRSVINACVADGWFVDCGVDLTFACVQSTALGLAHCFLSHDINRVAGKLRKADDLVFRVFATNIGGLLTPKGAKLVRKGIDNPFTSHGARK